MLSSLILSLAMSATPVSVDQTLPLVTAEAGSRRGTIRINQEQLDTVEAGSRRGTIRINQEQLDTIEAGSRRGTIRI